MAGFGNYMVPVLIGAPDKSNNKPYNSTMTFYRLGK
jgi:heme/copper-type cytochrome/quinol oxidase subunit 1